MPKRRMYDARGPRLDSIGETVEAPLAVTTSGKLDPCVIERARAAARSWGVPFFERRAKAPLDPLLARARSLLVFERQAVALCDRQGTVRFSPGMARLRIKRLQALRREDRFVELAEFRTGDVVLDCTLGLGADALVSAWAVGSGGRVVGLEKSLPLFALVSAGLAGDEANQACRIEVRHEDAAVFLTRQPARSFDLVCFDPMFDRPRHSSPAFEVVRRHADHGRLEPATLEEARRVARRGVLVKLARVSGEWRRLNLRPESGSRYSPIAWARLPPR